MPNMTTTFAANAKHRRSEHWQRATKDENYKEIEIVVLGSESVGKTALVNQFIHRRFPTKHKRTVDDGLWILYEEAESKEQYLLKIIDAAGSDEFIAMRNLYTSRADGIVLVYSIDDAASFEAVRRYREEALNNNHKDAPIIIVGNKIDLLNEGVKRAVDPNEAELYAEEANAYYLEVSAKDHTAAEQIFRELLSHASVSMPNLDRLRQRRQSEPVIDLPRPTNNNHLKASKVGNKLPTSSDPDIKQEIVDRLAKEKEERSHSCAIQ